MTADDHCLFSSRAVHSSPDHLMRHGVCKQDQEVRSSYLFIKISSHLCKNLCLASEILANLFILTDHSVMSLMETTS